MRIQKQIIRVVKLCKNSLSQISILSQHPKTELTRHALVQYMADLGEALTFFRRVCQIKLSKSPQLQARPL